MRIEDAILKHFIEQENDICLNGSIENYDLILDMLFNLRQATGESILTYDPSYYLHQSIKMTQKLSNTIINYRRGLKYAYGTGMPKDSEKAFAFLKLAAKSGSDDAQYHLGVMYEQGEGVPKNLEKAVTYYLFGGTRR